MSLHHTATLNTGAKIPTIGLGTWQSGPGEAGKSVYEALKVGYRHLDFALIYQNQKEIGEYLKKAWSELGIKREDVFITSKLWNSEHRPETVPKALDNTLNELGLDYLDLYLVHWPVAFKEGAGLFPKDQSTGQVQLNLDTSLVDTWKAMIALPKEKTRQVGVSNFRIEALEGIIKATGVVPAANQIERHPLLLQPELINYCAEKNIHITAYSAFGNNSIGKPLLINTPEVKAVAENASKRLGKPVNGAQVILAWSQVGPKQPHSVIPKSVTPARIASNFDEIELTPDEVAEVNKLGANPVRYNGSYWDINVFNDEDEKKKTHDLKIE